MTEDKYIQNKYRGADFIGPSYRKIKIIPVKPTIKPNPVNPPKNKNMWLPKNTKNLA